MPVPHPAARRAVPAALLALALVPALAGCGGDDPAAAPTTSAAAPPLERVPPATAHGGVGNPAAADAGPGIEAASAPARVACDEGMDATVPVTWSAPAAELVRLVVDGEPIEGERAPTGEAEVGVPCDGSAHIVLVVAVGTEPEPSLASLAVLAEPGG